MKDTPVSNAALLRDLARIKAIFQLRTIATVIGAPMPLLGDQHCVRGENDQEHGEGN